MKPTYLIDKEPNAVAYSLAELRKMGLPADTLVLPSDSLTWTPLQYLPEMKGGAMEAVAQEAEPKEERPSLLTWLKPLDFSTKTGDILVLSYFIFLLFSHFYNLGSHLLYGEAAVSDAEMLVFLKIALVQSTLFHLMPLLLLLSMKDRFFKFICFLLWVRLFPYYYDDIANILTFF